MSSIKKYKSFSANGSPSRYHKGDRVRFAGKTFIANNDVEGLSPNQSDIWEEVTHNVKYSSGLNPHINPNEGDRWLDTSSGKLYTYIDAGSNLQWVEY
tara:strand:- start:321 stop:614 length:294 start_codon:yes stop_codon:yes gene_type:complete